MNGSFVCVDPPAHCTGLGNETEPVEQVQLISSTPHIRKHNRCGLALAPCRRLPPPAHLRA